MNDILDLVQDPGEATALDQQTLDDLLAQGISIRSLTDPFAVTRAYVCFLPWADRYFPTPIGEPSLIFPVMDDGVLVDLAAWWPKGGRIGTRLGVGGCLGQGQIGRDGLGMADRPLRVFRSPLTWLLFRRRGLVIADRVEAAHLLVDVAITGEDEAHDHQLVRALTLRPPLIVRTTRSAA